MVIKSSARDSETPTINSQSAQLSFSPLRDYYLRVTALDVICDTERKSSTPRLESNAISIVKTSWAVKENEGRNE